MAREAAPRAQQAPKVKLFLPKVKLFLGDKEKIHFFEKASRIECPSFPKQLLVN